MNKSIREGFNKKPKKIWIFPYLGGWVGQEAVKIHLLKKKHAFKIHFRPFWVILDQLFFLGGGGWVMPGQAALESDNLFCDFPQNIKMAIWWQKDAYANG